MLASYLLAIGFGLEVVMSADTSVFDSMLADSGVRRESKSARIKGKRRQTDTVISQVSMPSAYKEKFTKAALDHGMSLSAFFRLAADEYIENHKW